MDTQMNFNFFNPTRILFGVGQLNNLHKQQLPGKKALLLISNGKSTKANGSFDQYSSCITRIRPVKDKKLIGNDKHPWPS